ncbi:hypothetical protein F4692_001593 [Nocardioides cavernae]|uniref:Uncharacterized protein n=1 Tax=Nocardioides cavernae TaxID=1921566 RepID=A0A7Y9KRD0_9ACTN|nr:hypothetical protein [Nocardioides cavernae]NYE36460.1 hypothetical protein [Nocardioides cavernae]
MVRRHAGLLSLALGVALLSGCSGDPAIGSDARDLEVARSVWADPWVAPTAARVAGPALGSNGQVVRLVARRTTSYAKDVAAAAQSELHWAKSVGWVRTSSTCGDTVQVALTSPTGDALAQLVVTPDGDGARAAVEVVARHHLDRTWPTPEPIARTCLDTTSPPFEPPPIQSRPLGDASAEDDTTAAWGDAEDSRLVDAVDGDPALRALGLRVSAPRLEAGVNRRLAPVAEATTTAPDLGTLAGRLDGWTLTYAACGGGGTTLATFARAYDEGWAVLGASLTSDGVDLRLTLPVIGGPDPVGLEKVEPLQNSACLADTNRLPRHSGGVPAVLPSDLTPIAE